MASSQTASSRAIGALAQRVDCLEAQDAARRVLSRYMSLCDVPAPTDARDGELEALFADDAIWEGAGAEYVSTFGRHVGPAAIGAFLRGYLPPSPHFVRNVHFLTSEALHAEAGIVRGHWIMQQVSVYRDGLSELISARLAVEFVQRDGGWRIQHFRTERLSCLPLSAAQEVTQ